VPKHKLYTPPSIDSSRIRAQDYTLNTLKHGAMALKALLLLPLASALLAPAPLRLLAVP